MSKNIKGLPFLEIEERVAELARLDSQNDKPKVRGVIQNTYLREIPRKYDWTYQMATTSLSLIGEYNDGSVSATTNGNTLTFSSDVVLTTDMNNRKIKINNNDFIYDVTYVGTTEGSINPVLYGDANPANSSYSIFEPHYSLPEDFDRFPKGGGLLDYRDGKPFVIMEEPIQEYFDNYNATPGNPEKCRIIGEDTLGRGVVEIRPAPMDNINVGCQYIKELKPLRATSSGLIGNLSSGGTAVQGDSNCKFTEATTGDYFRVNALGEGADSEWYRIATITNDTTMTLQTAFALTGITSASYAISGVPKMPVKMHDAILWGSLRTLVGDQDDPMFQFYHQQLAEVLSDGKRLYVTRIPNQKIETIAEDYLYRR